MGVHFRFRIVKHGQSEYQNSKHRKVILGVATLFLTYMIIYQALGNALDIAFMNTIEHCIKGEASRPNSKALFFIAIPHTLAGLFPVILDCKTYCYVKTTICPNVMTTSQPSREALGTRENQHKVRNSHFIDSHTLAACTLGSSNTSERCESTFSSLRNVLHRNDRRRSSSHNRQQNLLDIPLRATILSTGLSLPSIFFGFLAANFNIPVKV